MSGYNGASFPTWLEQARGSSPNTVQRYRYWFRRWEQSGLEPLAFLRLLPAGARRVAYYALKAYAGYQAWQGYRDLQESLEQEGIKRTLRAEQRLQEWRPRKEALTTEEFAGLVAKVRMSPTTAFLEPVLYLGYLAGLRISDIRRLRWRDVLPDEIRVMCPKGGIPYAVPLVPSLRAYLEERRAGDDDHVLTNRGRAPVAYSTISGHMRTLGIHTHLLRRSFGTNLLKLGMPIATVARLLDHKSIETTFRHYFAPKREELAREMEEKLT